MNQNIYDDYINYHVNYSKKYGNLTLILMQVGSFYEAYTLNDETVDANNGPDLIEVSQLLNIIRTRKDKGKKEIDRKNPYMLGFPTPSMNKYMNVLVEYGYTVIVIDQVTPPPNPKREVTGIYSPGTYISGPQKPDYNFVVSVYIEENIQRSGKYLLSIGMSALDISTGKTLIYEVHSVEADDKISLDECMRFINCVNPSEIIITFTEKENGLTKDDVLSYLELNDKKNVLFKSVINNKYNSLNYQQEFFKKIYPDCGNINPIEYLDLDKFIYATSSFIILLDFAYDHNHNIINNLSKPELYHNSKNLVLGNNAVYQLNIIPSGNERTKYDSVFSVVNNTSTHMGRRFLRDRLTAPLIDALTINKNYDYVEELINGNFYLSVENVLKEITDIERLEHKIPLKCLHPFELYSMLCSYQKVSELVKNLEKTKKCKNIVPNKNILDQMSKFIQDVTKTFMLDELKKHNMTEITTNIFHKGIYKDIDKIEEEIKDNKNFVNNLLEKINELFDKKSDNITVKRTMEGYFFTTTKPRFKILEEKLKEKKYIQVGNSKVSFEDFDCKFNLSNVRIKCDLIRQKSEKMNDLEDTIRSLNMKYYTAKLDVIYKSNSAMFREINKFVAFVDFLKSNAKTAKIYNYTKPKIISDKKESDGENNNSFVRADGLRHPIVEKIIDHEYVPQNIKLGEELKGILLYSLNGGGKSIVMKSIGIGIIMAQAGMYVPAKSFEYFPYNLIFTRITGNDNLFKGLSSYQLEMLELKAIIKRANKNALVIGDEVCRGTEPISGNAIVASTLILLAKSGASFIFATHLHDIANMDRIKNISTIKPYHLSVTHDTKTDSLIYDRVLKPGSGEAIYGITVAKYIIQDNEFINLANDIKNEITKDHGSLISGKTSKYNSSLLIHECQLCKKKDIKGVVSELQTHHINFQKDCKDGFVNKNNKEHIGKNDKANLAVLCVSCHDDIHSNNVIVDGYVETTKGKQLKVVKNNKKN